MAEKEVRFFDGSSSSLLIGAQNESDFAKETDEFAIRLFEERTYDYRLPADYCLEHDNRVVKKSRIHDQEHSGSIAPGSWVGILDLKIRRKNNPKIVANILVEVLPVKLGGASVDNYREEYEKMLVEITEQCLEWAGQRTDILSEITSPAAQRFAPSVAGELSASHTQKLNFMLSLIAREAFFNSIQRIINQPNTAWRSADEEIDVRRGMRLGGSELRQFVSKKRRAALPSGHNLANRIPSIPSVPERISVERKYSTVDTVENRFVKFALESFENQLRLYEECLVESSQRSVLRDVQCVRKKIGGLLEHSFFKGLSRLAMIPLSSAVLQRKEGYRQLLRTWFQIGLAAQLAWQGGDDIYSGGKRNVAVLYEYWAFFQLLQVVTHLFGLSPQESLIESAGSGFGLKLKSGKFVPIEGRCNQFPRSLHVKFSFNRNFEGNSIYPSGGSWTQAMRPDYSLSIWPSEFSEEEAEVQELIVHLHFDAKYKIQYPTQFDKAVGEGSTIEDELNLEKEEEREGRYKRADLLKMHAYRDAIRRTVGAYILYPGDKKKRFEAFKEILPGLGAFSLRPGIDDEESAADRNELYVFIKEVVEHFCDRASRREHLTYHVYESQKDGAWDPNPLTTRDKGVEFLNKNIPEMECASRMLPPEDIVVLVGYVRDMDQWQWIRGKGIYNFRQGHGVHGSLLLNPRTCSAKYLMLHSSQVAFQKDLPRLYKIKPGSMRAEGQKSLIDPKYKYHPSHDAYLVVDIEEITLLPHAEMERYLAAKGHAPEPFTITFGELSNILG